MVFRSVPHEITALWGRLRGAILVGKTWSIPADAELPVRKKKNGMITPLLAMLREQKEYKRRPNEVGGNTPVP